MNAITLVVVISVNFTNQFGGVDSHTVTHTMSSWEKIETCEETKRDLLERQPEAFKKYIEPEFTFKTDKLNFEISANCITK